MTFTTSARCLFSITVLLIALGATPAFAADTYELDPVHSTFQFRIKHLGVSYTYGRFNEQKGTIVVDEKDPSKNSIEIEIKTASVDTANKMRDEHLSGPDFFDVAKYPAMTFKSTSFKKKEGNAYAVEGDLTIHGVTKKVTLNATFVGAGPGMKGESGAGWEATLVINRADYGMNYMPDAIGTEVTLQIAIEGVKK
ncbi:MAG: YceI family protein [Candidatus Hydrogenedentales bacterium]|jgi:polyisoprenoid-binding protein YceI